MDIEPIKTQRDYRRVLKEIEGLMIARNTAEGDRLDVLVTLVEAWERKHYPLDLPDPVEAIKYHMEQNGLQPRDLIPFIGSRNRVHEVLNRQRPLTLKMIWFCTRGSVFRQSRSSSSNRIAQPDAYSPKSPGVCSLAMRHLGLRCRAERRCVSVERRKEIVKW
jgi:HTH-type transcriptional regulator/antitoxin HigA